MMSIIGITHLVIGQNKNYYSGYIIDANGQKIEGLIKDKNEVTNCDKIKFKNSDGKKVKFKNKNVKSYYVNDKEYVMMPHKRPRGFFNGKHGFMRVIERGKVDLYSYSYYVQRGGHTNAQGVTVGGSLYEKIDYYLKREGEEVFLVRKLRFKNNISKYLSQNENLVKRIKERELRYSDIRQIVQFYNK